MKVYVNNKFAAKLLKIIKKNFCHILTERRVDETFMVIVFLFAEKVVLLESYLLLSSVFYRYERLDKQQIHTG